MFASPTSLRTLTCLAALALAPGRAAAVDGVLLSVRYETPKMGNIHDAATPGKLIRYEIKGDKVVRSRALIDQPVVNGICISPLGDRVAITRADGALAIMSMEGGPQTELVRFIGDEKTKPGIPAYTGIQWPASEGGKWVYYMDGRKGGASNALRRVHVDTKKDELVVRFNRSAAGWFALTPDATPRSGRYVKRTDNYVIAIYDLSRGDGDLYNCPRSGGCGESASPEGSLFTANDGSHTSVALVDMRGRGQHSFRLSQWDGDPTRGLSRDKVEWAWQHFRWSTNSMNWIAVTQGKLRRGSTHEIYFADAMLYDWVNKKQINVTKNKPGTFDRAGGFWETGARESFLGFFSGKAPLTVEIKDARLSARARWDFGDGSPATTVATARHTYKKEGSYTLKVRQGGLAYQAQVHVQKRRPPSAVCHFVNEKCLLVEFNEAVRAEGLKATLAGGARVGKAQLNDTGRRLLVLLDEPLTRNDRLTLKGVRDLAQVPNALPETPLTVTMPTWPTSRADLVFLWENAKALNAVFDSRAGAVRELRVSRDQGMAGTDRYGRMRLEKGRLATGFYSQANAQMQFRDLVLADAFSLEVTLQSNDLTQKGAPYPKRIVNCSAWYDADWEFLLGQQNDRLMFSIRTTDNMLDAKGKRIKGDLHGMAPVYEIAKLPDTLPHHLVVSYAPGKLRAYLDGKKVFEKEVTGSLKAWGYGELCFGDNHNGGRHQWSGKLEGVAIYKRFVTEGEAARNHAAFRKKLQARKVVPQVEVQARLRATSRIPDLRQIAPYRDALVINEFAIEKVLKTSRGWSFGPGIKPGQKVRVAQWGLVDGLTTDLARAKVGGSYRLVLEVFTGHPEKVDELETSNSLAEDFEAPLLYEPLP